MSNQETNTEKKKISLKDAMLQQLAKKKENQAQGKHSQNGFGTNQKMKNQAHKKTNSTRRKMGS